MKILIFGAYGLLGNYLSKHLTKKHKVIKVGRHSKAQVKLNEYNYKNILKKIKANKPDCIINLIAQTDVDKCEKYKNLCFKTNSEITKQIVKAINLYEYKKNIFFILLSSDQVYSGKSPHVEKKINPINNYAKSKILAEKYASKINSCILRTNFLCKSKNKSKKSLNDWIYKNLKEGKKINVFKNIFFSPLYVGTLSKYLEQIAAKKITGTYNIGSHSGISKANMSFLFAKKLELNTNLLTSIDYKKKNLVAIRPKDMRLNLKKFEKKFKINIHSTKSEIYKLCKDY